ncbi:cutinase family protein [Mycobacterium sp.]|uniref:cutinase family protein n=1 Tax=Mycobacterium sp. TaxID=1785 RepID=UPI002C0B9A9C|nr:cutinase family protein [Mycobacterium sp.]HME47573.1 cutinase family protein [Mycobacterium sp.]
MDVVSARQIASCLAAAALMFGCLLTAPVPSASADGCPDVEVIFARGTGEPPGVGSVGQAFVNSLSSRVGGRSVGVYAVDYPATLNVLHAAAGANDVTGHLSYMAANCPNTRLVLGGFSQGAYVMDLVAGAPMPSVGFNGPATPDVAQAVAAVAVFGNPSYRILGGPLSSLSPQYGGKAIDLCNGNDPVCSNGTDRSAHSLYVESGMTSQAANYVAGLV